MELSPVFDGLYREEVDAPRLQPADDQFDLAYLPRFTGLETLLACSVYGRLPDGASPVFSRLKNIDLYSATVSEQALARLCLACPGLERLAVQLSDYDPRSASSDTQTPPLTLDEALVERAATLRHLELRAPRRFRDTIRNPRVGCLKELTNLEELVLDLDGLFGDYQPFWAGKDAVVPSVLSRLPPSLRRLEIVCQWSLERVQYEDEKDDIAEAPVLATALCRLHEAGRLPASLLRVHLAIPGPYRYHVLAESEGTARRRWLQKFDEVLATGAEYFGPGADVDFTAARVEEHFDNGRQEYKFLREGERIRSRSPSMSPDSFRSTGRYGYDRAEFEHD